MGYLGPATKPYEIMSLDTIGGFGKSSSTSRFLHLLVDHFTRHAYILCSKTQNSSDFIKLLSQVQSEHKIGTLLTDQFGGLLSEEFSNYLGQNGITHIITAVDAAFSNGINERLNQTLVNRIRCRYNSSSARRSWVSIAHRCVAEYNDTPHSVTGFCPKYLMHGGLSSPLLKSLCPNISNLDSDRKLALDHSMRNHNLNKKRYDASRIDKSFKVGDYIFVENGNKLNRCKLDEIRIGPHPIVEKVSNSLYKVKCSDSHHGIRLFHISKMVPCHKQPNAAP
jgi:hypothetical protein